MSNMSPIAKAAIATLLTFVACLGINWLIANMRQAPFNPNWIVLVVISIITGVCFYFTQDR